MKKTLYLFFFAVISLQVIAQAPLQFNYQAVLRDTEGSIMENEDVAVTVNLLKGSATGTEVFSETHNTTTNEFGLISLQIGSISTLNAVSWDADSYFLEIEVDGTVMGVTQLLSVPYALHAATSETITGEIEETDPLFSAWDKSTGIEITESQISDLQEYLTEETQSLADVATINNSVNTQIKNLTDPTDAQDAATKAYVDLLETYVNDLQGQVTALLSFYESYENPPLITTAEITEITDATATGGGNVLNNGGTDITGRGIVWHTEELPTLDNNLGFTTDGSGLGEFTSNLTGLTPETLYYVRAYATNSVGAGYGQQEEFTTEDSGGGNGEPGEGVTDIDGNFYPSVIIGNQEWMAENLRVTQYNNGDAIPTGLSNTDWENTTDGAYAIYSHSQIDGLNSDEEVVEAYGKLYNWYTVDDARGLCPAGWHVPTDAEWTELVDYVVAQGYPNSNVVNGAGNALKSCRQVASPLGGDCATSQHPRWDSHSTHYGTDEFGFSALPGGFRFPGGYYGVLGLDGDWWSSTEYSTTNVWSRLLYFHYGTVIRYYYSSKGHGFSVRCVRDN